MIIDVPFRSRIVYISKNDSRILAYLEEHVEVKKGKTNVTFTIQETADKKSSYLNHLGKWQASAHIFQTKNEAFISIRIRFKL